MNSYEKAVNEEQIKMGQLRTLVDTSAYALQEAELTEDAALSIIDATRHRVLEIFPDSEKQYELLIEPRLIRAMQLNRWVWVDRVLADLEGRTRLA